MANVIFTPAARLEIRDAYDWYEKEQEGLGGRLLSHLSDLIERISNQSHHFPFALEDVRRGRVTRFPYEVYFRERKGTIYVIACFHSSRNSGKLAAPGVDYFTAFNVMNTKVVGSGISGDGWSRCGGRAAQARA